jgi:hypothetical protein
MFKSGSTLRAIQEVLRLLETYFKLGLLIVHAVAESGPEFWVLLGFCLNHRVENTSPIEIVGLVDNAKKVQSFVTTECPQSLRILNLCER